MFVNFRLFVLLYIFYNLIRFSAKEEIIFAPKKHVKHLLWTTNRYGSNKIVLGKGTICGLIRYLTCNICGWVTHWQDINYIAEPLSKMRYFLQKSAPARAIHTSTYRSDDSVKLINIKCEYLHKTHLYPFISTAATCLMAVSFVLKGVYFFAWQCFTKDIFEMRLHLRHFCYWEISCGGCGRETFMLRLASVN